MVFGPLDTLKNWIDDNAEVMDYLRIISAGGEAGKKAVFVPGYNNDVDTTLEDITETGAVIIPVPASAIAMELVSSHAGDAFGTGTAGVRSVMIHGLDTSFVEATEIIELDGLTPVATSGTYSRINALHSVEVASHGITALGDIDIRNPAVPGTVYNSIGVGGNMSLQAQYTVPDGKVAFIAGWAGGCIADRAVVGRVLLRATCNWGTRSILPGVFLFQDVIASADGSVVRRFDIPRRIPARADIKISGQKQLGATGLEVGASFDLWIEDE